MTQRDYVSRGKTNSANKKKPQKAKKQPSKSHAKAAEQNNPQMLLWIRLGVVIALLLGFAFWLWSIKDKAPEPDNIVEPAIAVKNEDGLPELPEEEWNYIKSLPGYEVEVDETEASKSDKRYLMQCASFRTRAQAEEMKAKIAFQGFEALIRSASGKNGDWFKVILGPFDAKRDAERTRHALRRANITTCQIWFWNL
ncbi:SPOR domain-containing protein [Alteromonas sp. 5E99-2]|uniref:SPOR domain-containing protein n=1 Tax=Alteromonas sp. 5E99-2 TaxID=2817683 RepID=UPI001A994734|nr:SPOR domain-containing protein [Alteromonas sp. 5E99-2]MBO1256944.1 SPOR domain-containing protein [Alteromonas sp. 5E99-2]